MIRRASSRSINYVACVFLEPAGPCNWKAQARSCHHVMPMVPVFPELHDYPGSLSETRGATEASPYVPRYREKEVLIRTCGKIYDKWRREKRFWTVPKDPTTFRVRYLDTGVINGNASDSPVVLALHGSPGSYDDFTYITRHLYRSGARIVAPCFPGLDSFRMGKFRHTPEEKCEYARDFLKEINLPKVDMLVCHSSSLFPSLLMCLEMEEPIIKSVCLLNPTTFDMPRVMHPFFLIAFIARSYEFPIITSITGFIGKHLVGSKKQLRGGKHEEHFLSAFTMVMSDVPKRAVNFRQLVLRNFPTMIAFSGNDKLIDAKSSYKMARMLIEDDSEITVYDENGKLKIAGVTNPAKKVVVFEKGTHFLYNKHPDALSEEIKTFLFDNFKKN